MIKNTILIVDDEATQRKVIARLIDNLGYRSLVMNNGMEVIDFFTNKKNVNGISCIDVDVVLLDLSMPDLDGIAVLNQIESIKGYSQVIVLTADSNIKMVISAIKSGAIDYVIKGGSDISSRLSASIANAIERKNLKYQLSSIVRSNKNQVIFSDIIGQSPAICAAIDLAKKVVNSAIPVLIEGSNGVGKELLARAIHGSGSRSGKPFIVFDCDLFKKRNIEEELFGSERLTYDGLVKNIGKLREANGGTIFLDKIDLLKPEMQLKILRFIQDGGFLPATEKDMVLVNVKIISSINSSLEKLVMAKKFREDLHYRIAAFPIKVPSLKERGGDDIRLLAQSFCRDFSMSENKKIKGIDSDALYLIGNYDWEGNVRQLKNTIFRAVVLCDGDILKPEHFSQLLNKENSSSLLRSKSLAKKSLNINSELIDIFDDMGNSKSMSRIEEEVLHRLVEIFGGNISEVSKRMKIGRSTIYRKLKIF
jgi:DNA-binding NtrC family response regulator